MPTTNDTEREYKDWEKVAMLKELFQIQERYNFNDDELAQYTGNLTSSIRNWRNNYNLPANKCIKGILRFTKLGDNALSLLPCQNNMNGRAKRKPYVPNMLTMEQRKKSQRAYGKAWAAHRRVESDPKPVVLKIKKRRKRRTKAEMEAARSGTVQVQQSPKHNYNIELAILAVVAVILAYLLGASHG